MTRAERRAWREREVFAWSIRRKLPKIPVPLKPGDADVIIDLALLFETTYDRGRYAQSLPYGTPIGLPLQEADLHWATDVIKSIKTPGMA